MPHAVTVFMLIYAVIQRVCHPTLYLLEDTRVEVFLRCVVSSVDAYLDTSIHSIVGVISSKEADILNLMLSFPTRGLYA